MKTFFFNVLKPSNNESKPQNNVQINFKTSQNSSSLQSSKSFWNDPTRVNMVNNDEITLENDRILPSMPSSFSTSGQDSAIYSFSPSPSRPYVSNVFNSTDNSQNTLLYGSKHKKDKSSNDKNKKEEDDGGIVLLKSRIITDEVPVKDYGKNIESKSNKNIDVKPSKNIDSNKNGDTRPSDDGFMDKVLSTFTKPSTSQAQKTLRKTISKSDFRKDGNKNGGIEDGDNDDEGLGCTSILDKIITEAKEYVDGIGSEIKKTKAPGPPVPCSSQNIPKSVSDVKLDISMFEKGKLPDLKKKNNEKIENNTKKNSDHSSKIDQKNLSDTTSKKTNLSTNSNVSASTHNHKTNISGDHNEGPPVNMSQFFKVGVPIFVINEIAEKKTSKKDVNALLVENDSKIHVTETENFSDGLAERYIQENIILNKQQKPLQIKQSFGKKEENPASKMQEMNSKTKTKYTTSQSSQVSKVNDKNLESFGIYSKAYTSSSQQQLTSVKPIEIPSIFSNQEGKFQKVQKKPMVEIPKNNFVNNQLFKNQLEKIIANPITPAKKSKSMTSLTDNSNVGKEKKFKFLVEGIDIPARETEENNEETDPHNKKHPKGFAYVKGRMLADEVTKRASEVASRKPHEYVENYAIEKEILSIQKEFEEEEMMKARDELHAHVKSLFKTKSLKVMDKSDNIRQTTENEKSLVNITNNLKDSKHSQTTSQNSLGRRSKSDFDLSRKDVNIGQNHSIPHDTSRVFLKPHDQDLQTLKKLKKERHKYLNKKIFGRGDRVESEYANFSDSTPTDSSLYTRSKNNAEDTTTNKKNKFKSRSKNKNSHNTQVNSRFEAKNDYNTYMKAGDVYHQPSRQLLNRDNKSKNGLYNNDESQNFHNGFNKELNKSVFNFGEFEDFEKFEFEQNKHVRKNSKRSHIAHDNRGYDPKDYRSKNIVSGVISFPANLSKSLDNLHTTITGKVTVQKNSKPSGKILKNLSHSKVQITGPSINYKQLYNKNNKNASLPDATPFKHQNVQYNYYNRNKNMFNENLKSDVIWEEALNTDPELAAVSREGQFYKVQVRLNNTPINYRNGSSLSNITQVLGGYIPESHRRRGAFKSTNYIHDNPPALILPPPSEFSSHSVQNPSISTSYFHPIIYQNEAISSGVKSIQGEEERFAVKSIKSTETLPKTPPPNGIEFDLELLQTTQTTSNNVSYVSRNTNVTNQTENNRERDDLMNRQFNNKSPLLSINNQYRNDNEYNRDIENLVKGSVLIKKSLNPKQGNHLKPRENTNLFEGHYFQAKENPIYTSDFETIEEKSNRKIINNPAPPDIALDWEENGGFYKQVPINKQWYHHYIFGKHSKHNFSPKLPGPWKLRSSQNKGIFE